MRSKREQFVEDAYTCGKARPAFNLKFLMPTQNTDNIYEYRYEQRVNEYALRRWHNGYQVFTRGSEQTMPEWLKAVLYTAKVAGAIPKIKAPPPDIILWFRTDADNNLIEFIEMK